MKTMYSYNLNEAQKQQLLELLEDCGTVINTDMLFKECESFNCEVALEDDSVVDVRIFDPFHQSTGSWNLYTDATGWSEWLCGGPSSFGRIEPDTDKGRIYAYGYGCKSFGNADVEKDMQDYIDGINPGQYEVGQAEYFAEDDCWSAKLTEIL